MRQPQVDMRSCQLKYLLAAWKREDESKAPQRLRIKIPLSADLMWRLFDLLEVWFGSAPDFLRLYVAAFSLGFGLGLRPGEYLQPSLNSSLLRHGILCFQILKQIKLLGNSILRIE